VPGIIQAHLPEEPNSFIGREHELDELRRLVYSTRALTLCGPGGIGKTRLALRLLASMAAEFPDGAWFVELADLQQPDLVISRVAATLGVSEEPGRPLLETLADVLRRATIEWSYALLTEPERTLFRRLSVFAGWSLEMAEQVCGNDDLPAGDVLGLTAALVDKSLVVLEPEALGQARYRMLDTSGNTRRRGWLTPGSGPGSSSLSATTCCG
jgi:predicted ATPase